MGIKLTDADVEKRFNEIIGADKAWKAALDGVAGMSAHMRRAYTRDDVLKAVRDELRVAIACQALMGGLPPPPRILEASDEQIAQSIQRQEQEQVTQLQQYPLARPGPFSPYDFWKYYQSRVARLRVALIPFPVKTENIARTPTDKELEDFFNQFKDVEPKPNSPGYGFKVPQQMKVKWVSVKTDGPQFREQAQHALQLLPAANLLPVGALTPAVNSGPAAFTTLAFNLTVEPPKEYPPAAKDGPPVLFPITTAAGYGGLLADLESNNPDRILVAEQVGRLVGQAWPPNPLTLAVPTDDALTMKLALEERKLSRQLLQPAVQLAALGDPLAGLALGKVLATDADLVRPKSLQALMPPPAQPKFQDVRDKVKERLELGLAREIAKERMETLHKAFAKGVTEKDLQNTLARAQAGPSDAVATLAVAMAGGPRGPFTALPTAVFAAGHVLSTPFALDAKTPFAIHFDSQGETSQLADKTAIVNDPGMAGFRDASRRNFFTLDPSLPTNEKKDEAFGDVLFQLQTNFQPQQGPATMFPDQRGGGMNVVPLWFRNPEELILYWRTDNKEARTPEFKEVRDKVVDAWKLRQARQEAKALAVKLSADPKLKEILATSENADDIVRVLRELAAPAGTQVLELKDRDRVARLVIGDAAREGFRQYTAYQLPSSVPNSGPAFVEELMKVTLKKRGADGKTVEVDPAAWSRKLEDMPLENRVVVLADDRAQTYYLAVVLARELATDAQVLEAYKDGAPRSMEPLGNLPPGDPLLDRFVAREQTEYQLEVMKLLRAKAGTLDSKGQFDIPREFREMFKGGSDATE
jgi:hypothetical protein